MANFKRGRCRLHTCGRHPSTTFVRKRLGLKPIIVPDYDYIDGTPTIDLRAIWPRGVNRYLGRNPAWWDRTFHIRPHRARTRRVERAILNGADPDDTLWPVPNRPHKYYW